MSSLINHANANSDYILYIANIKGLTLLYKFYLKNCFNSVTFEIRKLNVF